MPFGKNIRDEPVDNSNMLIDQAREGTHIRFTTLKQYYKNSTTVLSTLILDHQDPELKVAPDLDWLLCDSQLYHPWPRISIFGVCSSFVPAIGSARCRSSTSVDTATMSDAETAYHMK
nr:unnamed protein product [Spirometra erinaceieuropaei]